MRHTAAACSLAVLFGCGGPSAPSAPPTPPPIIYPTMTGGWGGSYADTAVPNTASYACNLTVIVNSQAQGNFAGSFQSSPGNTSMCAFAGQISGNVTPAGAVTIQFGSSVPTTCSHDFGDGLYRGFLSGAGAITAQTIFGETCGGTAFQVTSVVTVNRR